MAGLSLVAGGAGGDADAPVAEKAHDDLALVAGEGDGQNMGELTLFRTSAFYCIITPLFGRIASGFAFSKTLKVFLNKDFHKVTVLT